MNKDSKGMLHILTYTLVVVGALNWGLIGLFDFNLVETILGSYPTLVKLVYILVGLSAVYDFAMHKTTCKICEKMMK
ncbi:hypothetical protein A3F32_01075 [Candidatus Roizmanbacteria bacterium RIFCSPHIGHO2_12_FULL_42_10]|uniref:DUF378 domain-containing protein n=2 Tax=Candidatus Roizmaniibacteriota TaxID=1752723 RepID=A0A1F7I4X4_9BACT|nr:MAG: hypothetical protein A3D08_02120 [Candidatus Roizmanbacteria bacterium RIFCSPHIGHO2_02_FULL_43_11]OGK38421.1 MAG: hypothetical protein A3F32_01075 [Candidatus Roizmanbacteria bacterium RIFCSPHIGHO2_12_FULL_42_10]